MAFQEYKTSKKFNWQTGSDPIEKTAFYELDITASPVVTVNTLKGIIEINNMENNLPNPPLPAFINPVNIWINNPELLLTTENRDNVYVQLTPYYKQQGFDNAVPYLVANGFVAPNGLGVLIYNASAVPADPDQWKGALYIYYEIYTIK